MSRFEKKKEAFYTGGGIWLSAMYVSKHTYAIVDNDYKDCVTYYDDHADIEEDQEFGCFDMVRSVCVGDEDYTEQDEAIRLELLQELKEEMERCGA